MTRPAPPRIAARAAPESSAWVLSGLYDVVPSGDAPDPDVTIGGSGDAAVDLSLVAAGGDPFRGFGDVLS